MGFWRGGGGGDQCSQARLLEKTEGSNPGAVPYEQSQNKAVAKEEAAGVADKLQSGSRPPGATPGQKGRHDSSMRI